MTSPSAPAGLGSSASARCGCDGATRVAPCNAALAGGTSDASSGIIWSLMSVTGSLLDPAGPWTPCALLILRECFKRVTGVHHRRSGTHVDRHAERLGDFLLRGAVLDRSLDVEADAIVATHGHRDGKRDQFLGLGVERLRRQRGLRHSGKGFHHLGCAVTQHLQRGEELLGLLRPVFHGRTLSYLSARLRGHRELLLNVAKRRRGMLGQRQWRALIAKQDASGEAIVREDESGRGGTVALNRFAG